jgi:predicted kinase
VTEKPLLLITRGLPASGKTTFAEAWVAEDPTHRQRVNRDDLRAMLNGSYFEKGVTEKTVIAVRDAAITTLLKRGLSVINDDTNLPQRTARDLRDLAVRNGATFDVHDMTDVGLELCLEREFARGKLGTTAEADVIIRDFHTRYLAGKSYPLPWPDPHDRDGAADENYYEPYTPDDSKPPAIIVDIDGTVALRGDRDPFDESRVNEDRPNQPVIDAVLADAQGWNATILFRSGRTDECLPETMQWLQRNVLPDHIKWDLEMRKTGDTRKDSMVKYEMFQGIRDRYNILRVYDDRKQVVEMWRSLGLTVLQVADGNF